MTKSSKPGTRIDKYLWTVRLYKTRSQASEACRKGRINVNGIPVKPSYTISEGDSFTMRRPPVIFSYKVTSLPPSRVSAKLVPEYLEDHTPESEKQKLEVIMTSRSDKRMKGTGRPTKKERRDIDRYKDDL